MEKKLTNKRIVFIDLDGTLIETRSGETHPIGVFDMQFRLEVLHQLRDMQPNAIFIVTNQGGIEKGYTDPYFFQNKLKYVLSSIQELVGRHICVAARFCPSNDPQDALRKPNPGMLEAMFSEFNNMASRQFTREECIMIGDASGKEGDFSDSDYQCAVNFGCDYMDVEEFIETPVEIPQHKIIYTENGQDAPFEPMSREEAIEFVKQENDKVGDFKYAAVSVNFIPPKPEEEPTPVKPEFKVVKNNLS